MPDNKNNQTGQSQKNQNEFELPTPQKKNEDVTTGTGTNVNRTPHKNEEISKHKGIEQEERKERKNPDNPAYQDAGWQQDKLNEANNQKGTNVDEKGRANVIPRQK